MEIILSVTQTPMFWQAMMMTSLMSMFIGALLYNGKLKAVSKALFTTFMYAALLSFTYISQVEVLVESNNIMLATIGWVTFFYCVGMLAGVLLVKLIHK